MMEFNVGDMLIGMGIGIIICLLLAKHILDKIDSKIREQLAVEQDQQVGMKFELVDNMIYCYHDSTDEFLCQGKDIKEICQAFNNRFPNRAGYIAGGDPAVVEIVVKQLEAIQKENVSIV